MRQWTLSLAVLALVAAPAFAGKYNKTLSVGDKAPAISGIPAVDGDKETTLNLADVKEDVVVVIFLANHCPVVKMVEDRQVELVKSFKGKSVKVIGVCCSGAPRLRGERRDRRHQVGHQGRQVQYHLRVRRERQDRQGLWRHRHPAVLRPRQGPDRPLHRPARRQRPRRDQGHQELCQDGRRCPPDQRDRRDDRDQADRLRRRLQEVSPVAGSPARPLASPSRRRVHPPAACSLDRSLLFRSKTREPDRPPSLPRPDRPPGRGDRRQLRPAEEAAGPVKLIPIKHAAFLKAIAADDRPSSPWSTPGRPGAGPARKTSPTSWRCTRSTARRDSP